MEKNCKYEVWAASAEDLARVEKALESGLEESADPVVNSCRCAHPKAPEFCPFLVVGEWMEQEKCPVFELDKPLWQAEIEQHLEKVDGGK